MLISLVCVDLVVVGRTDRTTLCDELVEAARPRFAPRTPKPLMSTEQVKVGSAGPTPIAYRYQGDQTWTFGPRRRLACEDTIGR
jgi:hypothetical protein